MAEGNVICDMLLRVGYVEIIESVVHMCIKHIFK